MDASGGCLPAGDQNVAQHLAGRWGCFAATFGGVFAFGEEIGVVVRVELLVDLPQSDFAEQHQSSGVLSTGETVVT